MIYRSGLMLIMVSATVAVVCGLYAYSAPLTGVTGTWGPLVAAFGGFCLLIGAALMTRTRTRAQRVGLMTLLALGILLTAFATFLLHQWVMLASLGACALGWLAAAAGPEGDHA